MTKPGVGLLIAGLWLAAMTASADAAAQAAPGGNPFRGRQLFAEKGCIRCHSVWGHGGSLGPDISVAVAGKGWDELVGDFWNHTRRMLDEVSQRGYAWPTLDPQEMADTLSYLYYLRLFDEPGNQVRGAEAFERLECAACHTLGGHGGKSGGALDRFGKYPSPTALAMAMWNAGPRMQQEQLRRGGLIVRFTGHEMADLQAYIRSEGRRSGRDVELQTLPSPDRGALVYRSKQCGVCHDQPQGGAPDISRSALSKTVSETTGLLWNHSYAMGTMMAARNIQFPLFTVNELSDLIAHLYFSSFLGRKGDAARGAAVFSAKGCADCHKSGKGGAPDLAAVLGQVERAKLASAMWNHAPQMYRLMGDQANVWPKFEPGEMRDLEAYLRGFADARAAASAVALDKGRRTPQSGAVVR